MAAQAPPLVVPASLAGVPWAAELQRWCVDPRYAEDRPALAALLADVDVPGKRAELEDAFSGPLPIGTGGRRGACGPGPNRMNATVVRETAQAVVELIESEGAPRRVAVAYDTRTHSQAFARVVAEQLAAWGIEVLLLDEPRPTPQLSFLVRLRGCGAGVVISASHNPPGDNGIKIYGSDGAQVLGARDRALMAAIERAMTAPLRDFTAEDDARIEVASGPSIAPWDAAYQSCVRAQCVMGRPSDASPPLRVVYTPLHGVGHTALVPLLRGHGVDVSVVAAQLPDGGRFATVASANPEVPEALAMAVQQAEAEGADLVLATDPDADRLGAVARDEAGALRFLDGNRMGVLLLDHVLRHAPRTKADWVLTTLLTSPLVGTLARAEGVDVVDDLLVGFKHHAGMMDEFPERRLLFACEESHGYTRGNDVHDKDGAIAGMLLAEAAMWARSQGRGLHGQLAVVFARHGYHRERTANLYAYGAAGREAIAGLLDRWRREPPSAFGGLAVSSVEDRSLPRHTGSRTRDLPGNVLVFELRAQGAAACRLVVRPSGTEPKAKLYALGRGAAAPVGPDQDAVRVEVDAMVDRVLAEAQALAESIMRGSA